MGIVAAFIGGTLHGFIKTGTLQLTAPGLSIVGVFIAVLGAIVAIYLYSAISGRKL